MHRGWPLAAAKQLLRRKQAEYGHEIYILADEPYRALVYDADTVVPFIPKYYDNTIFCYSYSKCLSIPGERMGYILVPPQVENNRDVYAAVCGAGRLLGYINNTSLFQYMLPACLDATADLSVYKTNRDLLCSALTQYGYEMARPDGAFYLFIDVHKCFGGKVHNSLELSRYLLERLHIATTPGVPMTTPSTP